MKRHTSSRIPGRPPAHFRTRRAAAIAALAAALLPAGCGRVAPTSAPLPHPHYAVGAPWQGDDGAWFYPAEHFAGSFSGLAVAHDPGPRTLADDGERRDPRAPAAAVQNLQLPCVLRVTDLANGRQILVRAIDRGPPSPARVLGLSARARALLGMGGAPTPVRVEIDGERSQALAAFLGGGPHIAVAAAPLAAVSERSLPPPGTGAGSPAAASTETGLAPADGSAPPATPAVLPQTVWLVPVEPWALFLDAGSFAGREAAQSVAARLGGDVEDVGSGRATTFRVRRGPFETVPEADGALDQALRAGVIGTRIEAE